MNGGKSRLGRRTDGAVIVGVSSTQTGRYRLLVMESQMADAWHGRVRVDVRRH